MLNSRFPRRSQPRQYGSYGGQGIRFGEPLPRSSGLPEGATNEQRAFVERLKVPMAFDMMDRKNIMHSVDTLNSLRRAELSGDERGVVQNTEILNVMTQAANRELGHETDWNAFWGNIKHNIALRRQIFGDSPEETGVLAATGLSQITDPSNTINPWAAGERATEERGYPERPFAEVGRSLRHAPFTTLGQASLTSAAPLVVGMTVGIGTTAVTANPFIGGAAGVAAGVATEGIVEINTSARDILTYKGVDVDDPDAVAKFLADEENLKDVQNRTLKRAAAMMGVSVAGLGVGLGAVKLAARAGSRAGKFSVGIGGVTVDGATEALGEGLGQYVSLDGEVDMSEVATEGTIGLILGGGAQVGGYATYNVPSVARRLGANRISLFGLRKGEEGQANGKIAEEIQTAADEAKDIGLTMKDDIEEVMENSGDRGTPRRFIHFSASAVAGSNHRELLERLSPMGQRALVNAYERDGTISIEVSDAIVNEELRAALEDLKDDVKWEKGEATVNEARDFQKWSTSVRDEIANSKGPHEPELQDIAAEMKKRVVRAGYSDKDAFLASEAIADNLGALSGLTTLGRTEGRVRGKGSPKDLFDQFMPMFMPDYDKFSGRDFHTPTGRFRSEDGAPLEATPSLARAVFTRLRDERRLARDKRASLESDSGEVRVEADLQAKKREAKMAHSDKKVQQIVNYITSTLPERTLDNLTTLMGRPRDTEYMREFTVNDLKFIMDPNNTRESVRRHFVEGRKREPGHVGAHSGVVLQPDLPDPNTPPTPHPHGVELPVDMPPLLTGGMDPEVYDSDDSFSIHPFLRRISGHTGGGADLKTLLHEYGHMQFIILAELHRKGMLNQEVANALKVMLKLDSLHIYGLSRKEFRRAHETFAEQWVLWLREGKAPSPILRRLYSAMALALSRIWRKVKQVGPDHLQDSSRLFFETLAYAGRRTDDRVATNMVGIKNIADYAVWQTSFESDPNDVRQTAYGEKGGGSNWDHVRETYVPNAPLEKRWSKMSGKTVYRKDDDWIPSTEEINHDTTPFQWKWSEDEQLYVKTYDEAAFRSGKNRTWDPDDNVFVNHAHREDYTSTDPEAFREKSKFTYEKELHFEPILDLKPAIHLGKKGREIWRQALEYATQMETTYFHKELHGHEGLHGGELPLDARILSLKGAAIKRLRDIDDSLDPNDAQTMGMRMANPISSENAWDSGKVFFVTAAHTHDENGNPQQGEYSDAPFTSPANQDRMDTLQKAVAVMFPGKTSVVNTDVAGRPSGKWIMVAGVERADVIATMHLLDIVEVVGRDGRWVKQGDKVNKTNEADGSYYQGRKALGKHFSVKFSSGHRVAPGYLGYEDSAEVTAPKPTGWMQAYAEARDEALAIVEKDERDMDDSDAIPMTVDELIPNILKDRMADYEESVRQEQEDAIGRAKLKQELEDKLSADVRALIAAQLLRKRELARAETEMLETLSDKEKKAYLDSQVSKGLRSPPGPVRRRRPQPRKVDLDTGDKSTKTDAEHLRDVALQEQSARLVASGSVQDSEHRGDSIPSAVAASRILHELHQEDRVDEFVGTDPVRLGAWRTDDESDIQPTIIVSEPKAEDLRDLRNTLVSQIEIIDDLFLIRPGKISPESRGSSKSVMEALGNGEVRLRAEIPGVDKNRAMWYLGTDRFKTPSGTLSYLDMLEAAVLVFGGGKEGWDGSSKTQKEVLNSYRLTLPIPARYAFENLVGLNFPPVSDTDSVPLVPIGPVMEGEPTPPENLYQYTNKERNRLREELPENPLMEKPRMKVGERLRKGPIAEEQAMFPGLGDAWDGIAEIIAGKHQMMGGDRTVSIGVVGTSLTRENSPELRALKDALEKDRGVLGPIHVEFSELGGKRHDIVITYFGDTSDLDAWGARVRGSLKEELYNHGTSIYLGLSRPESSKGNRRFIDLFRRKFLTKRGYNRFMKHYTPVGHKVGEIRLEMAHIMGSADTFFRSESGLVGIVAGDTQAVGNLRHTSAFLGKMLNNPSLTDRWLLGNSFPSWAEAKPEWEDKTKPVDRLFADLEEESRYDGSVISEILFTEYEPGDVEADAEFYEIQEAGFSTSPIDSFTDDLDDTGLYMSDEAGPELFTDIHANQHTLVDNARRYIEKVFVKELGDEIDDAKMFAFSANRLEGDDVNIDKGIRDSILEAEARKVQQQIIEKRRKLGKMASMSAEDMKVDPYHHALIIDLLGRHGIRDINGRVSPVSTEHMRERLNSLNQEGLTIPVDLLPLPNETTVPWDQLQVRQALALSDLAETLMHQSRQRKEVLDHSDKTSEKAIELLQESKDLESMMPKGELEGWKRYFRVFTDAGLQETVRAQDVLANRFGGDKSVHSKWFGYIFAPIEKAAHKIDTLLHKEKDRISAINARVAKSELFGRAGAIRLKNADGSDGRLVTGIYAMNVALLWGSSAGQRALENNTEKISHSEIKQMFGHFTNYEWDIIEDMWAHLESFSEGAERVNNEIYGIDLNRRGRSIPFVIEVKDADGNKKPRTLTGGRFPYTIEANTGETAWQNVSDDLKDLTDKEHVKKSLGGRDEPSRTLDLTSYSYPSAVNRMIRRNNLVLPLRDVRMLLNRADIQEEIKRVAGDAAKELILDWWTTVAEGEKARETPSGKAVRWVRMNIVSAVLGASIRTAGQQLLGWPAAAAVLGWKYLGSSMYSNGAPLSKKWMDNRRFMTESSEMMLNRARSVEREQVEGNVALSGPAMEKYRKYVIWGPISYADMVTSQVIWFGAYNKSFTEDVIGDHDAAVRYADYVVVHTQGSGSVVHRTKFQRSSEFHRMWFMFATPSVAIQGILYGLKEAVRQGRMSLAHAMWRGAMATIVVGILDQVIWGSYDDDDDLLDSIWKGSLRGGAYPFIYVREVIGAATSIHSVGAPIHVGEAADAILAVLEFPFKVGGKEPAEMPEVLRRLFSDVSKPLVGKYIPVNQVDRIWRALSQLPKEEVDAWQTMFHILGLTGVTKQLRRASERDGQYHGSMIWRDE